uniref:Uncharacterized protein n=1 Tax=Trichogramma kaykai TaxID=54128 RepID=A0ABD2VW86_9HYME
MLAERQGQLRLRNEGYRGTRRAMHVSFPSSTVFLRRGTFWSWLGGRSRRVQWSLRRRQTFEVSQIVSRGIVRARARVRTHTRVPRRAFFRACHRRDSAKTGKRSLRIGAGQRRKNMCIPVYINERRRSRESRDNEAKYLSFASSLMEQQKQQQHRDRNEPRSKRCQISESGHIDQEATAAEPAHLFVRRSTIAINIFLSVALSGTGSAPFRFASALLDDDDDDDDDVEDEDVRGERVSSCNACPRSGAYLVRSARRAMSSSVVAAPHGGLSSLCMRKRLLAQDVEMNYYRVT